jgi:hypothetical protein
MIISLRIDEKTERQLSRFASMEGRSKSALIRSFIDDFLRRRANHATSWELGRDLIGRYGSGKGNLSADRKAIFKEKMHAKYSRH